MIRAGVRRRLGFSGVGVGYGAGKRAGGWGQVIGEEELGAFQTLEADQVLPASAFRSDPGDAVTRTAALVLHLHQLAGNAQAADSAQAHAVDADFSGRSALGVAVAIAVEPGDGHRERNAKPFVLPPAHIGPAAMICGPEEKSKRECPQ